MGGAPGAEPDIALAVSEAEIARCFPVMRQLRPQFTAVDEFVARIRRQQAQGYRLARLAQGRAVVACAGFRLGENLAEGRYLYVDDLVTDDAQRSAGHGRTLLHWLIAQARIEGCQSFTLDSGTWRTRAHAFYRREGLEQPSLHFRLPLA